MTKLAPEWVRTNDPVIRSPARYRWATAPAHKLFKCDIDSSINVTFGHIYQRLSNDLPMGPLVRTCLQWTPLYPREIVPT